MIGRIFSHYRILQHIGGGGMGVVYKAEDTRLKRSVALKFLPNELSRDPTTKERFIHEAQAASSLQHNNVCTVHEIDETDDGQIYIVMDLYDGETLREKIDRGPLPTAEATAIASQIAQGLAAAHARGILHRDIKPANVLLTSDGTVKIVDFGLAKLSGRSLLTMSGTTLGTVAYTSPEATRGEETDRRTDIWSLGVVYYQMLTGRLPFGFEHEQAVVYNIQNVEPPPLSPGIPAACERILKKSLEKDITKRYQSAAEMLADIEAARRGMEAAGRGMETDRQGTESGAETAPAGATKLRSASMTRPYRRLLTVAGIAAALLGAALMYFYLVRTPLTRGPAEPQPTALRRLAVLPFTNLRSDQQTDFLGFALADQIIGQLAYVKTILVRPSVAVRQYQNQTVDVPAAAKALNVDYVLTGNYLKEADIVRLSLELVDVRTDSILWRESIQESYTNAFRLEDRVSERVVAGLRVRFSPDEITHIQADVPKIPGAYELFLKGIAEPTTMGDDRKAAAEFRQSIAIDSAYAPAFAELAYRLEQIATYESGDQAMVDESERCYRKALALNPGQLTANAGLTSLYTNIGRTEDAFELAQRALAVNPNSAYNHFALGYVLRYVGLTDDAAREMEKALSLDPGNPRFRSIGLTYLYLGEYEKALTAFDLDGESPFSLGWKGMVFILRGDTAQSLRFLDRVTAMFPGNIDGISARVVRAHLLHQSDSAKILMHTLESIHTVDGEEWYYNATVEGMLNNPAATARDLRRAIEGGFFNSPLMMTDPFLAGVRNDPQVRSCVAEAGVKRDAFIKRFNLQPGQKY